MTEIPYWDIIKKFHKAVRQILKDANVVVYAQRLLKRFRPGMISAPTTLLVESDLSTDGQYIFWKTGAKSLQHFLNDEELEQLLIKIIDSKAAYVFSGCALLECRPELFTSWQAFIPTLLGEIEDQEWLAIDFITREFGTKNPVYIPTVLITTKDSENKIWRQRIVSRLRCYLPPDKDIDIIHKNKSTVSNIIT